MHNVLLKVKHGQVRKKESQVSILICKDITIWNHISKRNADKGRFQVQDEYRFSLYKQAKKKKKKKKKRQYTKTTSICTAYINLLVSLK